MSSGGGHRKVRNADEAVVDEEAASGLAPLGSIKRPSSQRRSSIGAPGERQLGRSISSRILERVRSMNDGRLVDKFNNLDKKIAKVGCDRVWVQGRSHRWVVTGSYGARNVAKVGHDRAWVQGRSPIWL